jgi:hypothetical protein
MVHDDRPTSKSVGRWMESIFGTERATLKKAISQGGEIEPTLERLFALNAIKPASGETTSTQTGSSGGQGAKAQPRALWSTSLGSHPSGNRRSASGRPIDSSAGRPSSDGRATGPTAGPVVTSMPAAVRTPGSGAPAPRRATKLPIVLGVGLVLAGIGVVAAVTLRGEKSFSDAPAASGARATATLEIRSEPPGAHVFVDGTPSGLRTPTVLTGLSAGKRVEVRLDKPGFEPATEQVTLADGQSRVISVSLKAAPAAREAQEGNDGQEGKGSNK